MRILLTNDDGIGAEGLASLERVLLFFPDPWHKKRHHKRRIVNAGFRDLLHRALAPAGGSSKAKPDASLSRIGTGVAPLKRMTLS